MTTTVEPGTEFGKSRTRKEDARLITGRTKWTDNISPTGTLHLAIVRSPFAHATITNVDTSGATELPNVVAAWSGADLDAELGAMPHAWPITEDEHNPRRPPMAIDTARFAGEAVAIVIARDAATAKDAAEAIVVDYDPLEPVLDMEAALADGATLVHPDIGTNRSALWVFDSGDAGSGESADANIAAAQADPDSIVVKRRFRQQRLIPSFMEPRSVVVDPTGEQFTIWSSTQVPHFVRVFVALNFGIPEQKLRVVAPDVGGGFGGKLQVTPEEYLTVLAAKKIGKPVKWTETRSESLLSGHHGRDQIQDITVAARKDGKVTAMKVELMADMGAYLSLLGGGTPILGAFMFNGPYKIPAYHFACTTVFTNKTVTDAYRGAGRPEATFGAERIMDEVAAELGMEPMEFRKKNWIQHEEFPFTTVAGLTYDSGNYEAATAKAEELFEYAALRREQQERRESGDPVQLGIGISTFTEMCGWAPSRLLGQLRYIAGGWEHSNIRMLPTGKVEVITGTTPHGQGHDTTWRQIAADALGVPFEDVEVLHGDTSIASRGLDTYGSRSATVGGIAVVNAAKKVIDKARPIAAHLMEASAEDIEFAAGKFSVRGTDKGMTIQEVAFATFAAHDYPEDLEASIDADATFDPVSLSFPHGTHLAAMEVDTETGLAKLRAYVCVDDVGTVINPLIVEGQVHGGLAQGISQALFEEATYDAEGTLISGTFADYTIPSAADLPSFTTDRTETAATTNSLGVKGVGEAGTIASTPAVVNGVVDAIRHLGVTDVEMPCTPQRVWNAIQQAQGRATHEAPDAHSPGGGLGSVDPNQPQAGAQ
ncbi:MAG: xanthine dehydrogenase family protein [Pseudonocardiales bacterium]|nr:xanthine dehydrogenase family protein [Pseudonocardiales bacterium]